MTTQAPTAHSIIPEENNEDVPEYYRGGGEDGDDLVDKENKVWGSNMYADNDDNEIDKIADTEEKRAFDARFLQECKEYEQENEADTMDDTETEEEREASFEKEIQF